MNVYLFLKSFFLNLITCCFVPREVNGMSALYAKQIFRDLYTFTSLINSLVTVRFPPALFPIRLSCSLFIQFDDFMCMCFVTCLLVLSYSTALGVLTYRPHALNKLLVWFLFYIVVYECSWQLDHSFDINFRHWVSYGNTLCFKILL